MGQTGRASQAAPQSPQIDEEWQGKGEEEY